DIQVARAVNCQSIRPPGFLVVQVEVGIDGRPSVTPERRPERMTCDTRETAGEIELEDAVRGSEIHVAGRIRCDRLGWGGGGERSGKRGEGGAGIGRDHELLGRNRDRHQEEERYTACARHFALLWSQLNRSQEKNQPRMEALELIVCIRGLELYSSASCLSRPPWGGLQVQVIEVFEMGRKLRPLLGPRYGWLRYQPCTDREWLPIVVSASRTRLTISASVLVSAVSTSLFACERAARALPVS